MSKPSPIDLNGWLTPAEPRRPPALLRRGRCRQLFTDPDLGSLGFLSLHSENHAGFDRDPSRQLGHPKPQGYHAAFFLRLMVIPPQLQRTCSACLLRGCNSTKDLQVSHCMVARRSANARTTSRNSSGPSDPQVLYLVPPQRDTVFCFLAQASPRRSATIAEARVSFDRRPWHRSLQAPTRA